MTSFIPPFDPALVTRIAPDISIELPSPSFAPGDPIVRPHVARYPGATLVLLRVTANGSSNLFSPVIGAVRNVNLAAPLASGIDQLLEISPLPFTIQTALRALPPGAPTFYLGYARADATPPDDELVVANIPLTTLTAGDMVFLGAMFQDGISLAPWAWTDLIGEALTSPGASDDDIAGVAAWNALADLYENARSLRVLDHAGQTAANRSFQIRIHRADGVIDGPWTRSTDADGNLEAAVAANPLDRPNPLGGVTLQPSLFGAIDEQTELFWSGDAPPGDDTLPVHALYGSGHSSPPGQPLLLPPRIMRGHLQILELARWFAPPPATVNVARFHTNSRVEPLVDGIPTFKCMVDDLLASTGNGNGAHFAGWAFNEFALDESRLDGQGNELDTRINALSQHLIDSGADVRFLVNKFITFKQDPDTTAKLVAVSALLLLSSVPPIFGLRTNRRGYAAITLALFLILGGFSLQEYLEEKAEQSLDIFPILNAIRDGIAVFSEHPATLDDNPLKSVPLGLLGINVEDFLDRFGTWHQKFQCFKRAFPDPDGNTFVAYVGGMDINENRRDTPGHQISGPYHDIHARVTGPGAADLFLSFDERWAFEQDINNATLAPAFAPPSPSSLANPASRAAGHIVQIARTHFRGADGTSPFTNFAPEGEGTIHDTLVRAIRSARKYIYIEDQYMVPNDRQNPAPPGTDLPDTYLDALLAAAENCQRLVILLPSIASLDNQPFSRLRRDFVLARLGDPSAWGNRLLVGAPMRRPVLPSSELLVSEGRCVLMIELTEPFRAGVHDSLAVILRDVTPSSIFVHIRVRMTEERDFIIEPAVPISIGPCRFNGLPCHGLHDLSLIPYPTLRGEDSEGDQALEWTRHTLNPLDRLISDARYSGVITVRTVDLNDNRKPLKEIRERLNSELATKDQVAFVLEDISLPFWNLTGGLPLPTHGLFGLRRDIEAGDSIDEAFNLTNAPRIRLGDLRLIFEQLLLRTPATIDPLEQFLFLQMALLRGGDQAPNDGTGTIGVSDDWTLQFGWRFQTPQIPIVIADAEIALMGFKMGISIQRFLDKDADYEVKNFFQLLTDLSLKTKGSGRDLIKLRSLSGKDLELPIRDLGWNLDEFSLGSFSFPEGVQLIFGSNNNVRFIAEEIGWIMDSNGARYFSLSGGVSVSWGKGKTNREPDTGAGSAAISADSSKVGIRFFRLRWRTSDNIDAPRFLLDGISLALRLGSFSLIGFGVISSFVQDGHEYKEKGFGLKISFKAGTTEYLIGAQLFFGSVSGPVDNFNYWLVGAQFSPIPLTGAISLVNLRVLLAGNMAPNLPPPDGHDQNMRLFRWYKDNEDAINLSGNRKLTAWLPKDSSWAFGAGLGVTIGGQDSVKIDGFFFYSKSPEEEGFLLAFEVFLFGNEDPVGFGVLEWDLERDIWHVLFGISISLDDVLPENIGGIFGNLASLTGTLYIGNRPGTIALGQLNDQSTWLSLRFQGGGAIETEVLVAYCLHIVDAPEGPYGSGIVASLKAGGRFGVGKVQVYGSFGFILGVWRNESKAMGLLAWLELGFRIKVFWVFNFGINAKVEFDFMGPDPTYRRIGIELRIETPWYLPDATFRFERIKDEPHSEQLDLVSTPIVGGEALQPGTQRQTAIAVSALSGDTIDEGAVFSMNQLRTLGEPSVPAATIAALVPVSVDSTIALNFKPSVDDLTPSGENTPEKSGTQAAIAPAQNDLTVTYELVELHIHRRLRFGPNAGQTSEVLETSEFLAFQWDKDLQRAGRWDPRRLLINTATPFSFVVGNPEADEALVRDDAAWPCCQPDKTEPHWHSLEFMTTPFGSRVPSFQHFSESTSALHWIGGLAPFSRPGLAAPAGWHAAVVDFMRYGNGVFAAIHFDERAAVCEIYAFWFAHSFSTNLIIEVYDGLDQIDEFSIELFNPNPPAPILVKSDEGMTSIVLRRTGEQSPDPSRIEEARTNWIEFIQMRYLSLREEQKRALAEEKCHTQETRAINGSGKLAWLPNHEYEISATTQIIMKHEKTEPQIASIKQKILFHTKGLPGLNAVERVGDELEPYVEARYPGPAPQTLYRSEPITLAFNEMFNILAPLNGIPEPDASLERNQILEWVLTVEKMGNATEGQRITQTSPDWIVVHRTIPLPPLLNPAYVLDGIIDTGVVREAETRDPFNLRLEAFLYLPEGCNLPRPRLHQSQVLLHEPVDPELPENTPQLWARRSTFRVNVRRKDGPFVERRPFDTNDFTAFDFASDGLVIGTPWRVTNGAMHVINSPSDNVRRLALFGDETWNHIQIYTSVDPQGGRAGLAVGISGQVGVLEALLALVDEGSGRLRIIERRNGTDTELGGAPLDDDASAPYVLQVMAFDDRLRVQVNETIVEAPRGEAREGRLALVAQGGGLFHDLVVEPLDAYRFYFQSSRYENFEAHIGSYSGDLLIIPFDEIGQSDPDALPTLLTETHSQIQELMVASADIEQRQRLFDRWLQTLLIPVVQKVNSLTISRVVDDNGNTQLLLLESPEPLPFSRDVFLLLLQRTLSTIPADDFPTVLLELATAIRFRDDRFTATITHQDLRPILARTAQVVRARGQATASGMMSSK